MAVGSLDRGVGRGESRYQHFAVVPITKYRTWYKVPGIVIRYHVAFLASLPGRRS